MAALPPTYDATETWQLWHSFWKIWYNDNMKNKVRDPMPPPDSTLEEIGEFWDTHSLADYWDETHEVEIDGRPEIQIRIRPNLKKP